MTCWVDFWFITYFFIYLCNKSETSLLLISETPKLCIAYFNCDEVPKKTH